MATVHVTVNRVSAGGANGVPLPVLDAIPILVQTMTSTGTAAANTTAASSPGVWNIVSDGAIFVAFGTAPVAASGAGHYIPAGIPMQFAATAGQKVSVIDAA